MAAMPSNASGVGANPYGKHGKWGRWRVVHLAYDCGWNSVQVHAHINSGGDEDMSYTTVNNILDIFEKTADVMTECHGLRVVVGSIPQESWDYILVLIHQDPSLFLDEISDLTLAGFGPPRIPKSTLCQNLLRANYTSRSLKQLSLRRIVEDEENWAEMVGNASAKRFLFIDFTHQNPHKMVRKHGRGQKGCRTYHEVDFGYGKRFSVLGLIGLQGKGFGGLEGGMIDYGITLGNADADMTCSMVYHKVLPHLRPEHMLVADNAGYFKDPRLKEMIEATGARLMFLNPYAKHENPIEESFSKKNAYLVRHRALAIQDPRLALSRALDSISGDDAAGYYRHAGFQVKTTCLIPGVLSIHE
jgi:transposase